MDSENPADYVQQVFEMQLKQLHGFLEYSNADIASYQSRLEKSIEEKKKLERCIDAINNAVEKFSKTTLVQGGLDHA